jgi:S1-C subfamily serine protease
MKRIVLIAALLVLGFSFSVQDIIAQTQPLASPSKVISESPANIAGAASPKPPTLPVGTGSGLWEWTPHAAYHDSIVEVSTSHGSGTGVLIKIDESKKIRNGYEGMVLTAWHVVQDDMLDGEIKVTYKNKRRSKGCQIVEFDEAKDVAVLWVWVPEDIKPAKLATESIKRGDKLELVGLGGGTKLADCVRSFTGQASPPSSVEKIFADVPLLPGDSGGPVFNAKHEVVGIISGGWFWWDSGLKTASGAYIRTTWPARASNVGPLQSMMAKIAAKETSEMDSIETIASGDIEMMKR